MPDTLTFNLKDLQQILKAIAEEADTKRLTAFVDQFQTEYPDIYNLISEVVELPPDDALNAVCQRWPALNLLRLHPNHQRIVIAIQTEIKNRKGQ